MAENPLSDRELAVSRLIEGTRDAVFEAFTEVRHLPQWWGPTGFTTTTRTFEFSEGGVWESTIHAPDGTNYPNCIKWIEIRPPELIVLRRGERSDDPEQFTTSKFEERPDGAQVTLRTEFQTKACATRRSSSSELWRHGSKRCGVSPSTSRRALGGRTDADE